MLHCIARIRASEAAHQVTIDTRQTALIATQRSLEALRPAIDSFRKYTALVSQLLPAKKEVLEVTKRLFIAQISEAVGERQPWPKLSASADCFKDADSTARG